MYAPRVSDGELVRTIELPRHTAQLTRNPKSEGLIEYFYILTVVRRGSTDPVLYVTVESSGGPRMMCVFHEGMHQNYGTPAGLDDIDKFEQLALRVVEERLG